MHLNGNSPEIFKQGNSVLSLVLWHKNLGRSKTWYLTFSAKIKCVEGGFLIAEMIIKEVKDFFYYFIYVYFLHDSLCSTMCMHALKA